MIRELKLGDIPLLQLASVAGPRVIHAHVSEQPAENAASTLVHGLTPTQLFDHSGLLSERERVLCLRHALALQRHPGLP